MREQLKKLGYIVKFQTHRHAFNGGDVNMSKRPPGVILKPRGGKTICDIMKGNNVISTGVALCHPIDDVFNVKTGRKIALERAVLNMIQPAKKKLQQKKKEFKSGDWAIYKISNTNIWSDPCKISKVSANGRVIEFANCAKFATKVKHV